MHIGIIPDGNRRWAKENSKDSDGLLARWISMVESRLTDNVVSISDIENACKGEPLLEETANKVTEISLFVMSIDNIKRTDYTTSIIYKFIEHLSKLDLKLDFSINLHGQIDLLPESVKTNIDTIISKTKQDSEHKLHLAIAYDPKIDIVNYANNNRPEQSQIDLVVRSGREQRTSGFFPCHTLYSEWCFMNKLWPDMNKDDLKKAIEYYNSKQRRFGK